MCLLMVHQRNSVGVIDSEWRGIEEGVDVRGSVGIQCC